VLTAQSTTYPAAIARVIAERHERHEPQERPDGRTAWVSRMRCSATRFRRWAAGPLGRLRAVTDATPAVLRGDRPDLSRVSIALRGVAGEFDLAWGGSIAAAARSASALPAQFDNHAVHARLGRLDAALQGVQDCVRAR
jgi:hypothetical protein